MYATYGIPTIKKSCPISDVSYRFYRCYHTKLAFQHHNLKTDIQVEIISVRPCTLRGLNERPSLRLVMVPMVKALHENYLTVKLSHISISINYLISLSGIRESDPEQDRSRTNKTSVQGRHKI